VGYQTDADSHRRPTQARSIFNLNGDRLTHDDVVIKHVIPMDRETAAWINKIKDIEAIFIMKIQIYGHVSAT
jgi:hypothetical protein